MGVGVQREVSIICCIPSISMGKNSPFPISGIECGIESAPTRIGPRLYISKDWAQIIYIQILLY